LPRIHLALLAVTVLALIVIGMGKASGLRYVKPGPSASGPWKFGPPPVPPTTWNGQSPNLKPWPQRTGYIDRMVVNANKGTSQIVLGNALGKGPVYAMLCVPSLDSCMVQRHVFIQPGTSMTLEKVSTGRYDVRFVDLADPGHAARSQPITIGYQTSDRFELELGERPLGDSS
jgi:hypothetical protein